MPRYLKDKNAPLFPVPSDEEMAGIKAKESAPLLGPEGSHAESRENLVNLEGLYQSQSKKAPLSTDMPSAPLRDSDFHDGTFTRGTKSSLDTGGVV